MYKHLIFILLAINLVGCTRGVTKPDNVQTPPEVIGTPVLKDSAMISLAFIDSTSAGINLYWIQDDGGHPITSRGLVWDTLPNPTLETAEKMDNGSDVGGFSTTITGLKSNTIYYVREFATNSAGTSYSEQRVFKTLLQFKDVVIGSFWGGGIVFYFLQPGDATYNPNETHGFIVNIDNYNAAFDSIAWNTNSWKTDVSGTDTPVTFGYSNTGMILSEQGGYCAAFVSRSSNNVFSNWCLPSKDELNLIYLNVGPGASGPMKNRAKLKNVIYWTSSQYNIDNAWLQNFDDGTQTYDDKTVKHAVCQIREF